MRIDRHRIIRTVACPASLCRAFSFREHGRLHHRLPCFAVSARSHFGNTAVCTIACPASLCPRVLIQEPAPLRCVRAFSFREHGRPHHRLPHFAVSAHSHFGNMVVHTITCPASLCPRVLLSGTWLSAPSPAPLCCVRAFSFWEHGRPHHRLPRFTLSMRSHFGNAALGPLLHTHTHTFSDSPIERHSTFQCNAKGHLPACQCQHRCVLSTFLSPPHFHVETTAIKGPHLQPNAPPPSDQWQADLPSIVSRRPKCAACVSPRRARLPALLSASGSNALGLAVAAFSAPPAGSTPAGPWPWKVMRVSTPTSEPVERVRGPGMFVTADHAPPRSSIFSLCEWVQQG